MVLLTSINEISHSKEALILYGHVQGFTIEITALCLYRYCEKLDTLLYLCYYELLTVQTKDNITLMSDTHTCVSGSTHLCE